MLLRSECACDLAFKTLPKKSTLLNNNNNKNKSKTMLVMTFIDVVAPKGAVFVK